MKTKLGLTSLAKSEFKQPKSIFDPFFIDPNLPLGERVHEYSGKLQLAIRYHNISFLIIGKLLAEIRAQKLYEAMGYSSFTAYCHSEEISFSREKSYLYIRLYEFYLEYLEMEEEEVSQIGVERLMKMLPDLKEMEDKGEERGKMVERIGELSNMRYNDFLDEMSTRNNPGGKPVIHFSESEGRWVVGYYEDTTKLYAMGVYAEKTKQEDAKE